MSSECFISDGPSLVEIRVSKSDCSKMPLGDVIILEGPQINYSKSGPVCITALNAIYPWIMISRYGIKAENMDWDDQNSCYHGVCPCGTVVFDIKNIKGK